MDKLLTESGLKAILSKHKVKDNGLQKALAAYDKLEDDAHDDCLDQLAQIGKLATALKKVKEVAANKAVADYLDDLLGAKTDEEKDVTKDQQAAAKTEAAKQKADKKKEEEKDEDKDKDDDEDGEDDGEQEEGEYGDRLMAAFKKCKSMHGETMDLVICDARPLPFVMLARRITSRHRKELTAMADGSKKFHRGTIHFDDGKYIITTAQELPGLVKKLQRSVKTHIGKMLKLVLGDEEGDEGGDTPEAETEDNESAKSGTTTPQSDAGSQEDAGSQDDTSPQGNEGGAQGNASPQASAGAQAGKPAGSPTAGQTPAGNETPENAKKPFSIKGSVGQGGKNSKEDVEAVQTALNLKAHAGLKVDGQCDAKTIAAIKAYQKTLGQANADGLVSPGRGAARGLAGQAQAGPPPAPPAPVAPPTLPKPELKKAPEVWHKTRDILKTNIDELKKAVKGHYAAEHPDLVKEIDKGLGKLDGILKTLDTGLADSLGKAAAAAGEAARKAELQNSKVILTNYIKYVKAEPLIAHIDKNPFGVDTNIKKVLTDSLTHMAQAMA